jgi:hypothetical protein
VQRQDAGRSSTSVASFNQRPLPLPSALSARAHRKAEGLPQEGGKGAQQQGGKAAAAQGGKKARFEGKGQQQQEQQQQQQEGGGGGGTVLQLSRVVLDAGGWRRGRAGEGGGSARRQGRGGMGERARAGRRLCDWGARPPGRRMPARPAVAGSRASPAIAPPAGKPGVGGPKKHKKKPTKEELLRAAEARAARTGDAQDEAAKSRAAQLAWQAALSRAQGERVLDDPKLLRRSIKREAKAKQKSAKKWQERVGAQQEAKQARQDRCALGGGSWKRARGGERGRLPQLQPAPSPSPPPTPYPTKEPFSFMFSTIITK